MKPLKSACESLDVQLSECIQLLREELEPACGVKWRCHTESSRVAGTTANLGLCLGSHGVCLSTGHFLLNTQERLDKRCILAAA
jgi:hypothetical protein